MFFAVRRFLSLISLPTMAALLLLSASCSENTGADTESGAAVEQPQGGGKKATPTGRGGGKRGTPLPAFEGRSLGGETLSLSDFIGRRFLLFGFNPGVEEATEVADAVREILAERADHNFEVVGVALEGDVAAAKNFIDARGLAEITTIEDTTGELAGLLRIRAPVWMLLVDADGNIIGGAANFSPDKNDRKELALRSLREILRLPGADPLEALFGEKTRAPLFSTTLMEDDSAFKLADHIGRPFVLIFFLHTCPHCHHALNAIKKALDEIPEESRPLLFGVSIVDRPYAVLPMLKDEGLDFFPVLRDSNKEISRSYGAQRAVPVTYLVNAKGEIEARVEGWRDERDPPLMRMRLLKMAGRQPPMLLHNTDYSGNEFCGVCHERQALTWELTGHAGAYDTLVKHGADHDSECVSCHVVGYGESGGYQAKPATRHLENVGCETCHGRGGPHLSPEHARNHDYEAVCVTCHNPTHSLGFEYATFLPKVSHAANMGIASLPEKEREALLAARRKPTGRLPVEADYVGTPACLQCHAQESATWSEHPHARAYQTLEEKREHQNGDCLTCHTTGYAQATGFPKGGADTHAGLEGVGCESCHGPGGDHVAVGAERRGTILSLGDKCDSCVILQICGSCHDDANDPGFEFEVLDKIEHQRHGTIEAGTGLPLDRQNEGETGAWNTAPAGGNGADAKNAGGLAGGTGTARAGPGGLPESALLGAIEAALPPGAGPATLPPLPTGR